MLEKTKALRDEGGEGACERRLLGLQVTGNMTDRFCSVTNLISNVTTPTMMDG